MIVSHMPHVLRRINLFLRLRQLYTSTSTTSNNISIIIFGTSSGLRSGSLSGLPGRNCRKLLLLLATTAIPHTEKNDSKSNKWYTNNNKPQKASIGTRNMLISRLLAVLQSTRCAWNPSRELSIVAFIAQSRWHGRERGSIRELPRHLPRYMGANVTGTGIACDGVGGGDGGVC